MRSSCASVLLTSLLLAACGGFLGFSDDSDEEQAPVAGDAGADSATTVSADGEAPTPDAGDGSAANDGGASLFPRLANFEGMDLVGPNGADTNDGMVLLAGTALAGTYSARTVQSATKLEFAFNADPPAELWTLFTFRVDTMPSGPAPMFRLGTTSSGVIAIAVVADGKVLATGGDAPTLLGTIVAADVRQVAIHVRVSPALLEAALIPAGPPQATIQASPVIWSKPANILVSAAGDLNGTTMRMTLDDIRFSVAGFDQ